MSIKGFVVNGQTLKYDYNALDNKPSIPSGGSGLTDEIKTALLQLASKVAYIDTDGGTYYQDLYDALYTSVVTLTSISAVYTQTGTVYDTDSLDSLRSGLVVTAYYSNNTSQIVTGYTLAGTLSAGVSTITVMCQGKTTTFNVTVTAAPSTFSVTNSLTNCTNSNGASKVTEWASYSGTLYPLNSDYVITSVTITMGGTDVTNTAYSNGTISIANVTGNIVITAVATQRVATLSSISAVFVQGSAVVYTSDTLDSLKQYLTVTATWSDSSTSVLADSEYTLSGTLTAGTSTITASYGGKTDTFTVTVTAAPTNTTAVLDQDHMNKGQSNTFGTYTGKTNFCPTIKYELGTLAAVSSGYDYIRGIIPVDATGSSTCRIWLYYQDLTGVAASAYGSGRPMQVYGDSMTEGSISANPNNGYIYMTIPICTQYIDYAYLYVQSSGKVLFAGKYTPYYGMENISEAE